MTPRACFFGPAAVLMSLGSILVAQTVDPAPVAAPLATPPAGSQPDPHAAERLPAAVPSPHAVSRAPGYRGIWWGAGHFGRLRRHQLSGGLGLAPMDHAPVAHYAAAVEQTFFVYAGTSALPEESVHQQPLQIMVGAFDHTTRRLAAPVVLMDDLPAGAYGCPAMSLDESGRLWVFVAVLGAEHPSVILRSTEPYRIDAWEMVMEMEFQQPQAWHVPGHGLMLLHTRQVEGMSRVHFTSSADGLSWSRPTILATFGEGQSCISGLHKGKVGVAITQRAPGMPPESREDLYYLETIDFGRTWQVYPRARIDLPLASADNPARILDRENWRFFLRDLAFDGVGNPVIFYHLRHVRRQLTAPESRVWSTSRWTGREWESNATLFSDSDHDAGCLMVDRLLWTAYLPTPPGPQPGSSGGEIVRWRSEDQGRSWAPQRLTFDEAVNHNWVRRVVDGRPEMVVLWADGHTHDPSESRLYFADQAGNVFRLPLDLDEQAGIPEQVWSAPAPPLEAPPIETLPLEAPIQAPPQTAPE